MTENNPWDTALNPPPPSPLVYDGHVLIAIRYVTGTGSDRRPWIAGVDQEADRKIGVLIALTPILGGEVVERIVLVSNPDWRDLTLPSVYKCQGLTPGVPLPPGVQNPLEALNGKYVRIKLVPRTFTSRDGRTVTMRSLIFEHVYESQAQCWETAQHSAPAAKPAVPSVPAQNGQVPSPTPQPAPQQVQQPLPETGRWPLCHALPDGTWLVVWQSGQTHLYPDQMTADEAMLAPEPQA